MTEARKLLKLCLSEAPVGYRKEAGASPASWNAQMKTILGAENEGHRGVRMHCYGLNVEP